MKNRLSIFIIILILLFFIPKKSLPLPVWQETIDTNQEDRIGIEDNSYDEFDDNLETSKVVEYHIGDMLANFTHRLEPKLSPSQTPHTVHILFETNSNTDSQNLILSIKTDDATGQNLGILFDGHSLHQTGGEIVINSDFRPYIFWLGTIEKGEHRITVTNETKGYSSYGIYFDYVKLVMASINTIHVPEDFSTIKEAVQNAYPGDIIKVANDKYEENNIILKSGLILQSKSLIDPNQIDPNATIIDAGDMTAIHGAYQAKIKGFTIRNSSMGVSSNQEIGIKVAHDFVELSNNIILHSSVGIFLTGQDLVLVNNTIAQNDCCLWIEKSIDANTPLPNIICKNNIMSDSNCAIYLLTESNNESSIDPNFIDQIIKELGYNNISTAFISNLNLISFEEENIYSDPYFKNRQKDDYHLMPYSPCIDAGDPTSNVSREPYPNGDRINLGAFGNTNQAQKSDDSDGDGVLDYLEGAGDRNQNGNSDWQDSQCTVFVTETNQGFESGFGEKTLCISLQDILNTNIALKNVESLDYNESTIYNLDPPNLNFFYGFWKFEIEEIDQSSKTKIAIYCPNESFYNLFKYYMYDDRGWISMPITRSASESMIIIELSDGGIGDRDMLQNGSISHTGGLAIPYTLGEGYTYKTCFISNLF